MEMLTREWLEAASKCGDDSCNSSKCLWDSKCKRSPTIATNECAETALTLYEQRDRLEKALSDMLFAYTNKDADVPHQFEIEAIKEANLLLKGTEYFKSKIIKESEG